MIFLLDKLVKMSVMKQYIFKYFKYAFNWDQDHSDHGAG